MTNDEHLTRPHPATSISRRRVLVALGIAAASAPLAGLPGDRPGRAAAAAEAEAPAAPAYHTIVGLI